MKLRQFLEHHGIAENPFADEDAQTDLIFKGHCILSTYHPTWDKIYGSPSEPATAIVFGEKGSGKTALRLQIVRHLADHNADHPDGRAFVIQYDDFNPFIDRFRDKFSRRRRIERVLGRWKLWDHMDAILSLGVTQLVDRILGASHASHPAVCDTEPLDTKSLDATQVRDIMLLAACYDRSTNEAIEDRWRRLRRKLGYSVWRAGWDLALGVLVTAATLGTFVSIQGAASLLTYWPYLVIVAGWLPRVWRMAREWWRAKSITRNTRVLNHRVGPLRRILMNFRQRDIASQPVPTHPRSDDRYELLVKLQDALKSLGFVGVLVLVDRVDEPYLVNGSPELMRVLVWPLLDNKFLKHSGVGVKMLLPAELGKFVDQEDRDFHQRARLDKQNLVRSLAWTGQSLYDLANARLVASVIEDQTPSLRDLFDESIDDRRLIDAMQSLRVPRHLFKFLYRLFVTHTNAHTDDAPVWTISSETFESVLALYRRDVETDGLGTSGV